FRHGRDVYLVARRNLGPAFGTRFPTVSGGPRKLLEWASYWLQPKRTAIYRLDQAARRVEAVVGLPSAPHPPHPSLLPPAPAPPYLPIARLPPHELLIATPPSVSRHPARSGLGANPTGTALSSVRPRFDPPAAPADANAALLSAATAPRVEERAASAFDEDWP